MTPWGKLKGKEGGMDEGGGGGGQGIELIRCS